MVCPDLYVKLICDKTYFFAVKILFFEGETVSKCENLANPEGWEVWSEKSLDETQLRVPFCKINHSRSFLIIRIGVMPTPSGHGASQNAHKTCTKTLKRKPILKNKTPVEFGVTMNLWCVWKHIMLCYFPSLQDFSILKLFPFRKVESWMQKNIFYQKYTLRKDPVRP